MKLLYSDTRQISGCPEMEAGQEGWVLEHHKETSQVLKVFTILIVVTAL